MVMFCYWPVHPALPPEEEHIVIGAITENTLLLEPLLSSSALPGSAGLEGNGYRLQQKSPSDGSHVTPLFPGRMQENTSAE